MCKELLAAGGGAAEFELWLLNSQRLATSTWVISAVLTGGLGLFRHSDALGRWESWRHAQQDDVAVLRSLRSKREAAELRQEAARWQEAQRPAAPLAGGGRQERAENREMDPQHDTARQGTLQLADEIVHRAAVGLFYGLSPLILPVSAAFSNGEDKLAGGAFFFGFAVLAVCYNASAVYGCFYSVHSKMRSRQIFVTSGLVAWPVSLAALACAVQLKSMLVLFGVAFPLMGFAIGVEVAYLHLVEVSMWWGDRVNIGHALTGTASAAGALTWTLLIGEAMARLDTLLALWLLAGVHAVAVGAGLLVANPARNLLESTSPQGDVADAEKPMTPMTSRELARDWRVYVFLLVMECFWFAGISMKTLLSVLFEEIFDMTYLEAVHYSAACLSLYVLARAVVPLLAAGHPSQMGRRVFFAVLTAETFAYALTPWAVRLDGYGMVTYTCFRLVGGAGFAILLSTTSVLLVRVFGVANVPRVSGLFSKKALDSGSGQAESWDLFFYRAVRAAGRARDRLPQAPPSPNREMLEVPLSEAGCRPREKKYGLVKNTRPRGAVEAAAGAPPPERRSPHSAAAAWGEAQPPPGLVVRGGRLEIVEADWAPPQPLGGPCGDREDDREATAAAGRRLEASAAHAAPPGGVAAAAGARQAPASEALAVWQEPLAAWEAQAGGKHCLLCGLQSSPPESAVLSCRWFRTVAIAGTMLYRDVPQVVLTVYLLITAERSGALADATRAANVFFTVLYVLVELFWLGDALTQLLNARIAHAPGQGVTAIAAESGPDWVEVSWAALGHRKGGAEEYWCSLRPLADGDGHRAPHDAVQIAVVASGAADPVSGRVAWTFRGLAPASALEATVTPVRGGVPCGAGQRARACTSQAPAAAEGGAAASAPRALRFLRVGRLDARSARLEWSGDAGPAAPHTVRLIPLHGAVSRQPWTELAEGCAHELRGLEPGAAYLAEVSPGPRGAPARRGLSCALSFVTPPDGGSTADGPLGVEGGAARGGEGCPAPSESSSSPRGLAAAPASKGGRSGRAARSPGDAGDDRGVRAAAPIRGA
ncbi:unnamed protein product [Prorocentrum cordatum]|nr:unnamed protein product [Polarella glacialis]